MTAQPPKPPPPSVYDFRPGWTPLKALRRIKARGEAGKRAHQRREAEKRGEA